MSAEPRIQARKTESAGGKGRPPFFDQKKGGPRPVKKVEKQRGDKLEVGGGGGGGGWGGGCGGFGGGGVAPSQVPVDAAHKIRVLCRKWECLQGEEIFNSRWRTKRKSSFVPLGTGKTGKIVGKIRDRTPT